MTEQKQETPRPPPTFNVTYCDKCGRTDQRQRLSPRHFAKASLCVGGTLKVVTYRRDDSTIRIATE